MVISVPKKWCRGLLNSQLFFYPFPLSLSAPFISLFSSDLCDCNAPTGHLLLSLPPSLFFYLSPSSSLSLYSPCMCPFIPPVFEGQVLTASWHVVRPTMQDCAVALCLRGQGRPTQVHYITPINTDWAQDGAPWMLMSSWPGPAHMPLIQEQMWSTDPELSLPLFPSLCPIHCLKPAMLSWAMLCGPLVKQV